ncbi:hypothetical protein OHA72_29375 [Dactylosporangium sp. NBC_01737]|uniref:hypothetical protein n=1 Tax=Dactylosporangium sp. NBC_01737 TaxID=2975959 RepID=UPI002E11A93D|nr:hypothetical protein OHA72_29375 [Dactylosporangium sp. NBC_01737]
MPCVRCGQPGYASGADALCATHGGVPDAAAVEAIVAAGGPSPLWQVLTAGFAALGVAHVALQAMNIWALRRADAVIDDVATLSRTEVADALRLTSATGPLARDGLWVYLTLFLLWLLMIGAVATRLGFDRRTVLRHWTILVWRVALVPTLVFALLAGHSDPADWAAVRAVNQNAIAFSATHILTTALLVGYTTVVWRRLRPVPLPELV